VGPVGPAKDGVGDGVCEAGFGHFFLLFFVFLHFAAACLADARALWLAATAELVAGASSTVAAPIRISVFLAATRREPASARNARPGERGPPALDALEASDAACERRF
jgi:hypothetical protein